jgi:hypothetical protein
MDGRICKKCGVWKLRKEFHAHKQCKDGINTVCKTCRRPLSVKQHIEKPIEIKLFFAAKARAKKKEREFNLELSDITIPERCPVLGALLQYNSDYAPSIDRIDSSKGYIKGNIRVISKRANVLKNNATIEELKAVLKDLEHGKE